MTEECFQSVGNLLGFQLRWFPERFRAPGDEAAKMRSAAGLELFCDAFKRGR
jgi:hypothetical protein